MALRTSLRSDEIAFGGDFAMAIASHLDDFDADPETKRVLHAALEMTRAALGLADDFANGIIAKQIVELCQGRLAASRRFVRRRIEEITRAFARGLTGAPSKRPRFAAPRAISQPSCVGKADQFSAAS